MNGDFALNQLFYEITLGDLYGMPVGVPNEIGTEGEVYDHVVLTNMVKIGKCTMLGDFFGGPMERPLKVFPWEQGYDLFDAVEYQIPFDALVPEVDFGILSAGLEPYTVTKSIQNFNLEHNASKWGFLKAKVTIAPVIINPFELTQPITRNGEHTIVKRGDENGMSMVTFTVNVSGGGLLETRSVNCGYSYLPQFFQVEPSEGYYGIGHLNISVDGPVANTKEFNITENGTVRFFTTENLMNPLTGVIINTNVPVTEEIKTNIRYISLVDNVNADATYYYDISNDTISLANSTRSITVEPDKTLIIIKKVDRSYNEPYNEYRLKIWSIPEDQYNLDFTVEAGEYYVKKNHFTSYIVFYDNYKEKVTRFKLYDKYTFNGILQKWMYAGQINFNLDLIKIPNIIY